MNKKLIRLMLLLAAVSAVGMFILYPSLPELVPTNVGATGEVNGYSHKSFLLWMQLAPLASALVFFLLPKIDPRRENYTYHKRSYGIIAATTTAMMIALSWAMALPGLTNVPPTSSIYAVIGITSIVLGNYLPTLRSNFFMGIRTPWALSDEVTWRKTHRVGGMLFVASGVLLVVCALLPRVQWLSIFTFVVLLGGCAALFPYSYFVYKKQIQDRKEEDTHAEN